VLGTNTTEFIVADITGEFLFGTLSEFNSTNFIIIRNLNYSSNSSQPIDISVFFELNETETNVNTSLIWSVNKSIKAYSKTFGEVNLTNKTESFCAKIVTLNANDSNQSNNLICFFREATSIANNNLSTNMSESDTSNKTTNTTNNSNNTNLSFDKDYCNIVIYSNKLVYSEGESISFEFEAEENSFNKGITYWIEDSRRKIVKSNLTTNSNAAKHFTPKLERSNELFSIRAEVGGCENYSELNLFFAGSEQTEPEKLSFLRVKETKITTTLFSVNLEGYRNSTNKKTIYIWIDGANIKKEKQKFLIEEKEAFFFLNLVFDISYLSKNTTIYLHVEGLDSDLIQNYSYVFPQTTKTSSSLQKNTTLDKEETEVLNIPSSLKTENTTSAIINSKTTPNSITGNVMTSKSGVSSSIFSVVLVIVIFTAIYFLMKVLTKYFKKRKII